MGQNPLDSLPAYNRLSLRAVVTQDGGDPTAALAATGIVDPVSFRCVVTDSAEEAAQVLGPGIMPHLRAVLADTPAIRVPSGDTDPAGPGRRPPAVNEAATVHVTDIQTSKPGISGDTGDWRDRISAFVNRAPSNAAGSSSLVFTAAAAPTLPDNENGGAGFIRPVQLVVPAPAPPPIAGQPADDPSLAAARYLMKGWQMVTEAVTEAFGNIVNTQGSADVPTNAPSPSIPDPTTIAPRPDVPPQAGGRGGQNVKSLTGPPNSAIPSANGDRIYITDDQGRVILDVDSQRAKIVRPGLGFQKDGKIIPTPPGYQTLLDKVFPK